MDFYSKPRFWIVAGVLVAALFVFQQFWHWEVERIEVGPNQYLVRIHRWGKDLPEDTIVAPDASYQGVMLEVGQEGRHFLNPLFWGYDIKKMVEEPFAKAAFALQPGQLSDLVQTTYGMHLIKVTDRKPGKPSDYSAVRDEVFAMAVMDMRASLLMQLRKTAKVEINLP